MRCANISKPPGLPGPSRWWACDKARLGTLAALLEHIQSAIIMSDGSIHPGTDPNSCEKLDLVSAYQVAGDLYAEHRHHIACHACPGYGSCGDMFTSPPGDLHRRRRHGAAADGGAAIRRSTPREGPHESVGLVSCVDDGEGPARCDIVAREFIRNAVIDAMAIGARPTSRCMRRKSCVPPVIFLFPERRDDAVRVQSSSEHVVLVVTDARPDGKSSMVDIDPVGGVQVIVRELARSRASQWRGDDLHRETLAQQVKRLGTKPVDGQRAPSRNGKPTSDSWPVLIGGILSLHLSAILKLAGASKAAAKYLVPRRACVLEGEQGLLHAPSTSTGRALQNKRHDHCAL